MKRLWTDKVGNHFQLGGIELATLNNGSGRGVRIANINTGSGLRYKVVIDRCCDISDAFFNQHSLCWLSHSGITTPRTDEKSGLEWLYTFGGGLMTTCGLSHIGGPTADKGLHGRISNTAGELVSVIQPDIHRDKLEMSLTAVMRESRVFGPCFELRRTISSILGKSVIKVKDVITNCSNSPSLLKVLYHCNFGWPLIDTGTELFCDGKWSSVGRDSDNAIFNSKNNFRRVSDVLKSHSASGEACAIIEPKPDKKGICTAGARNSKLGLSVSLKFKKSQLPWLTNWQHLAEGEYVVGLEPGSNPAFNRGEREITLAAAKSKTFELEFEVNSK